MHVKFRFADWNSMNNSEHYYEGTTSDVYISRREDDNDTPSDRAGEAGAGLNFLNHFWAEIQNWFGS